MVQLPVLTFNNPIILILLSGLLIIILKKRISLIVIILSLFLSIQIFWSASFWPGRDWMAVNCDVGQGDGLVINLGKNSAIIIDTGPDEKAIDQCLNKLEIKNIPLLILTHFHFDHVGAVSAVRKGRSIGEVWISNLHEPVSSYEMVMKELNGLKVISVFMGQKYELPNTDTQVQLLWPDKQINEFKVLPGDGSKVNNSSISVIVRNRFLSIFAGGDIEPEPKKVLWLQNC
jgi:competence protein ComEC